MSLADEIGFRALEGREIRFQTGRRVVFEAHSDVPSIRRAYAEGFTLEAGRAAIATALGAVADVHDVIVRATQHVFADDTVHASVAATFRRDLDFGAVGELVVGALRRAGARLAGPHWTFSAWRLQPIAMVVDPQSVRYFNTSRAPEPSRSASVLGTVTNVIARDAETNTTIVGNAIREVVQSASSRVNFGQEFFVVGVVIALATVVAIKLL